MKHYLNDHPTLIEDLSIAAGLTRDKRPTLSLALEGYAKDLALFDKVTGFPHLEEDGHGYLMHVNAPAFSSLKAWQKEAFKYAAQFDGNIFTRAGIEHLGECVRYVASRQRNYPGDAEVRTPDWAFDEKNHLTPSLSIGHGLSIAFIPIKGWYFIEEGRV